MKSIQRDNPQAPIGFVNSLARFLLFLLSFLLVSTVLLWEEEPFQLEGSFKMGEPAPRSVFAPFAVSYLDAEATERKKNQGSAAVALVFDVDRKAVEKAPTLLSSFLREIEEKKRAAAKESVTWESAFVDLGEDQIKEISTLQDIPSLDKDLKAWITSHMEKGIFDFSKKLELMNEGWTEITARGLDGKEGRVSLREIATVPDAVEAVGSSVSERFGKERKLKNALNDLARELVQPSLIYNDQETRSRQKRAYQEVAPVYREIKQGEVIVTKGTLVTPDIMKQLEEIVKKGVKRKFRIRTLGMSLISLVIFLALMGFLYYFEPKLYQSFKMLALIHSVIIVTLLIEKLILSIQSGYERYLLPASAVSLILGLLVRPRTGVLGAIVMGVFSFLLTRLASDVLLYSVLGGIVGAYLTIGLRKRVQFLKVGAVIGLANFACIFGTQVLSETRLIESFYLASVGFGGGLLAIALVFILLPILENLFGLLTDITLLELCDLNHPLLRRMVVEAPGTYHHSLVVATLAESACESIGANGLLARVGGYFHDIGKIEKAEYFTENQRLMGAQDRHEKLRPEMSSLIIANHVKDGIELARKYKLKQQIIDFIPQHQGTCPVYYFYRKAEARALEGEKVDKDNFRYAGPKPQTRETAAVLLADSVEAASRSLASLTPEGIEELVKDVINEKFVDGQLDECNLTFEDLRKIQESFIQSLIGISHTRVEYPKSHAEPVWHKIANRTNRLQSP